MSQRDDMVIVPRLATRQERGPREKAAVQRRLERAKRRRLRLAKTMKRANRLRAAARAGRARRVGKAADAAVDVAKFAGKWGPKVASRLMGPAGLVLLANDAVGFVGDRIRRGEQGVSGRLLAAMDRAKVYGDLAIEATAASRARGQIESNELLLGITGAEGRVTSQIAELGAWFKDRERAIAVGEDLIEREKAFDSDDTIADQGIRAAAGGIKAAADELIDGIRWVLGKGDASGR